MSKSAPELTRLLEAATKGDGEARERLAREVHAELRKIAAGQLRRESANVTAQPTSLASDAFARLFLRPSGPAVDWESRGHFYAVASTVMRRVLVDRARARRADKRGGGAANVEFDEQGPLSIERDSDVLRVDEALERLAEIDPRQAEFVQMRFFGGLGMQEIADGLGISKRAAEREWTLIKAWLRRELST